MTATISRRRFLTITAAFAAVPAMAQSSTPIAEWRGTALGAGASLHLVGLSSDEAHDIFGAIEAELLRLENIFSLYKPQSALSRLNRAGRLSKPPLEMLELLSLAGAIHARTNGAFDPTIQPLWALYAKTCGHAPDRAMLDAARARTGWAHVRIEPTEIIFARPGMAITLNGIAQGYITDQITTLLRGRGFKDILVDMGEIVGRGHRPDGRVWQVGIAAPDGRLIRRTTLTDRALATSSPMGTLIGNDGNVGHILDPRIGVPVAQREVVSVSADRAALADALSTAFCIMDDADVAAALLSYPTAKLELLKARVNVA